MHILLNMVSENFLNDLKSTGIKVTVPRKEILKILSGSPMSAQEVHEILKEKGFNVDLVTIYRTLELFNSLELVRKTQFEDKSSRYELVSGEEHHHHLVCIKCGLIEDVEISEDKFVKEIEKQSKFKVERHSLEFFGFCKKCQN